MTQANVGSYETSDCRFLLKPVTSQFYDVADKERLIQAGELHYSQMIHQEHAPTAEYTELFLALTERYKQRLADEILELAGSIAANRKGPICLVSLARAGTPIGVLLQRALTTKLGRSSVHYSISIVRDRGIDVNALDHILASGQQPESLVFVDGWTAKGVITRELHRAIDDFNVSRNTAIPRELFVVSDIGGSADFAATYEDYTIPSALMNSTVSGLVSRSILNEQIGPDDFHGCVQYEHLKSVDRSVWFVDQVTSCFDSANAVAPITVPREERQTLTAQFLRKIQVGHCVSDINRVKPGIAEATRVMLRRVPDLLLVQDKSSPDVSHLLRLCREKGIQCVEMREMPFGACALIKDVLKDPA